MKVSLYFATWHLVLVTATWDTVFCCKCRFSQNSWYALSMFCYVWRWQSFNGFACKKAKALPISLAKVPALHQITVSLGGVMKDSRCCDRGNFPRTRQSGSRLSWQHSRRPSPGWCWCSIGERTNWLPLWVVQQLKVVGCCPGVQALTVRGCFVVAPVDMLAVEATNKQTGVREPRDDRRWELRAWRFVDVNDLMSCDVYAQPFRFWLFWRLIDQWPFQPLMDKRGNAVVPAQDWPN